MSTVNADLQIAYKDSAFFAANSTLVLKDGQLVYNSDTGDLFIGDNSTQLGSLTAINAGGDIDVGTSTVLNATNGYILYNNNGTLGEKNVTGTGDVVLATSPTLSGATFNSATTFNSFVDIKSTLYNSNTNNGTWTIQTTGANSNMLFQTRQTGGTYNDFYLTSTGNFIVGGTTDAGYKLDVQGNAYVNTLLQVGSGTNSGRALEIFQDTANFKIGSLVSSTSNWALYGNQTTPSTSNAALWGNDLTTWVNSTSSVNIGIANSAKIGISSTSITISDAVDLVFNTSTGSKIGTATTQKIGFWNATPIVQPSGWGTPSNTLTRTTFNTSTATLSEVAERLGALITDLKNTGLIGA